MPVNREAFDKVIGFLEDEDRLEEEGVVFNMMSWYEQLDVDGESVAFCDGGGGGCMTACCIGGSAAVVLDLIDAETSEVRKKMGLTEAESSALFYPLSPGRGAPKNAIRHSYGTQRPEAVQLLRDIRDGVAVLDEKNNCWVRVEKGDQDAGE